MFRTRPPLSIGAVLVFLASLTACFGGEGRMMRNGDDVVMAGGSPFVRALDSIPGDAILFGGDTRFEGTAGGDYLGAGGNQTIAGHVHGSVRAAGGEIHVSAGVDRNATIAGGDVSLDSAGVVSGNAYITGGNVTIVGAVRGGLLASGGNVTINGPVGRDVEVVAGGMTLGPRAQIAGNLRYRVDKSKVRIDPAAKVAGTTTALPPQQKGGIRGLLWLLGFVIAGVIVVAIFPRFTIESAETLYQRPVRAGLAGLAWACLVPVLAVIAAITFIGLPLAIVAMAAWFAIVFMGDLPVALWLGKKILGDRAKPGRSGAIYSALVGGVIIAIVGLVPVLGPIVTIIVAIFGAGAMVLRLRSAPRGAVAEYAI